MTNIKCVPVIEPDDEGNFTVWFDWTGVDKRRGYGISAGRNRKLAERLLAAAQSGVVFEGEPEVLTNVLGQTYVRAGACTVRARALNADLRRIGY